MARVEERVTRKNGRCLGYKKNEHLESNLPCKPEGFSLQNCPPLARKHINKMVGGRTESWSSRTWGGSRAKRKENFTPLWGSGCGQ